MKIIIAILLTLFIQNIESNAKEVKMNVMARNKRFRLKETRLNLPNLTSNNSFEGKNFKIVQGKSNNAILFTNQELRLKAATVYYHLEKARKYFIEKMNSSYVENLSQIIIRIEHKNKFNELGHFANDNLDPQFNNALSIPAGDGYEPAGIKPWGHEIWFSHQKRFIYLRLITRNLQYLLSHFLKHFDVAFICRVFNDS